MNRIASVSRVLSLGVVLVGVASAGAAAPTARPVDPAEFKRLHTLIKPAPAEEKGAEIPWLASLWDARKRAAAEGKPILLWEMDGHPLGCT